MEIQRWIRKEFKLEFETRTQTIYRDTVKVRATDGDRNYKFLIIYLGAAMLQEPYLYTIMQELRCFTIREFQLQ